MPPWRGHRPFLGPLSLSISFQILRDYSTVYVRYEGLAHMGESLQAFSAYVAHPDYRPGQRQLVDLSGVTGFDRDFAGLLKAQALKADQFDGQAGQTLIAYFAPGRAAQEMAAIVLRSWEGFHHVAARILEDEAAALAFLGLPKTRIADLLETAG